MKFSLTVLFLCVTTLAQSKESSTPPAGVPAGAVRADGQRWRWVDAKGTSWLYTISPFGLMRSEEPKVTMAKRPDGVPVDALPISEGVWRWVDSQHKVWLFQQTPTGLMRSEEPKGAAAQVGPTGQKMGDTRPDAVLDLISVKEEGDNLRFSRPGPFGTYSWVKKKTEIDKDETIVWERAKANSASVKKD